MADKVIAETAAQGHQKVRFIPVPAFQTADAMDSLCQSFQNAWQENIIDKLLLTPMFILDFLCIHPFNDGNGRMSRLLTTLLLYRSGFYIGRYISLEAKIAKNKDLYYDALSRSQAGWHEGTEDVVPFIKYMLSTILAAYKDFDDRFAIVEEKLPAIDMVRKAAQNRIGRFTKQDILDQCPSLSLSSVEGALRRMVAAGELRREGAGKATCYVWLKQ